MKPWVIGLLVVALLALVATAIYFTMKSSDGSSPSKSPTPTPEPEKVPENVTVLEPALGEQEPVMGCMDSMAANYNPDANENDGSCIDYVFADNITGSFFTSRPGNVDPDHRYLTFHTSDTCKNKQGQELIDCALPQFKICKKLCDDKDWCKGFATSIWGKKDQDLSAESIECYFAKDDNEIEKFNETHTSRSFGYLKA